MFAINFYAKTFQGRANQIKIRYRMGMNENRIREYYDTILFYDCFTSIFVLILFW